MSDISTEPDLGEDLLTPSRVCLFGKEFTSLKFDPAGLPALAYRAPAQGVQLPMPPNLSEQAVRQQDLRIARIYGFSFEGTYHKLPRPLLFLVRGKGVKAEANGQFQTAVTGMASKGFRFGSDVCAWHLDRLDTTVCLDLEVGTLQPGEKRSFRVVLNAENPGQYRNLATAEASGGARAEGGLGAW